MMRFYWMTLAAVAAMLTESVALGQDVDFCLFPLSEGALQAHANFNAVYEFDVDQHGIPAGIKPVAAQFTRAENVQACVSHWRMPTAASKHLAVVFEWQHGVGWTKMTISGADIKLTIHLSGQRCPYCTAAPERPNGH